MPRKRRSRPKAWVNPFRSYIFRIASWEPAYHLAVNDGRLHPGPYWEHAAIELTGECLAPAKVAGRTGRLTFMGRREQSRELEQPPDSDWKPLGVGTLTIRGERTEFLGSIPFDALWGLIAVLPTGTLRFVDLYGERQRYGGAKIRSIRFCRELDPDDLEFAHEQR